MPFTVAFNITIPQVEEDTYHRLSYTVNPIFAPLLWLLALQAYSVKVGPIPVWVIVELVGFVFAIIIFFTTKNYVRPSVYYNFLFVADAFIMSILWIYLIANELVSLLETIGLLFDVSVALLGMTVLAWGNSISDMVADVVVARQGYPGMGIAACFGGPMFNMMIGLGASITYYGIVHGGKPFSAAIQTETFLSFGTLIVSLVSTLIVLPLTKFTFLRPYAAYLLLVYIVFTVLNLLTLNKIGLIPNICIPSTSLACETN